MTGVRWFVAGVCAGIVAICWLARVIEAIEENDRAVAAVWGEHG